MSTGSTTKMPKGPFILAILIITVGVGWLMSAQGIGQGINWVWTLSLGVVGVVTFVLSGGLDKFSVVVGPFFLISSLLSVLRQTNQLSANVEVPILVILVGFLFLLAQMPFIRYPSWVDLNRDSKQ